MEREFSQKRSSCDSMPSVQTNKVNGTLHLRSKSNANSDYKNIVKNAIINGNSVLGDGADVRPQFKSSNKIFLARISGPQVTQAAQKRLGGYNTAQNVRHEPKQEDQIEFKNGSNIYSINDQKQIKSKPTLHNQKKMMKFNKSKQNSLDLTSQFNASASYHNRDKSGGHLNQKKKLISPKTSLFSGTANVELIKSLYHQDISTKQSDTNIGMASDALNDASLFRPGSQTQNKQRLKNAKVKGNLMNTSQDTPFDAYTAKTVGSAVNTRQIKTQQQNRSIHNTSSKFSSNALMDSRSIYDTSGQANRTTKMQKKADGRPMSSQTKQHHKHQHSSFMSQNGEDLAKQQANIIVQKLNKRILKNMNLQLSEDQILQNYSNHNSCHGNKLRGSIESNNSVKEISSNNIFNKLQMNMSLKVGENPIKINQTIETVKTAASAQPQQWGAKKTKQIENLKAKLNQGLVHNVNFQKGNIISQDHMRQLLGTSNKNKQSSHFNVRVPSAQKTYDPKQASFQAHIDTIQTLPLSGQPSQRKNHETLTSEFESLYQDFKPDIKNGTWKNDKNLTRHQKRHSLSNVSLTTGRVTTNQKAAYYLSPQKNLRESYQHQKEESFVKINDIIHQMFDNVSGTPIRNSLQGFVNIKKQTSYNNSQENSPRKQLMQIKEENHNELMVNSQSNVMSQPKIADTLMTSQFQPTDAEIAQNDLTDEMEAYLQSMKEVKNIQNRLNENPNVHKIVKNKGIQDTTFLSPFTILENSFLGLTCDHLQKQATEKLIGRQSQKPNLRPMHEVLKQSKLKIMSVQNDLKRIVDTGEMHTQLNPNHILDIELFPKITKCFVIDLKEFENPLIIRFKYQSNRVQKVVEVKVDKPEGAVAGSDGQLASPAPVTLKKEVEKKVQSKKSVSGALSQKGQISGDLYAYGSFKHKEPNESNTWQQIKNQPRKVVIKEVSDEPYFSNKFFYLTLESTTGIKVSIMAATKPDQDNANKKASQKKKEQKLQQEAANKSAGIVSTTQKSGGNLCSQQRQDIMKAINDKNVELVLMDKMEDALERQRIEKKNKRSGISENNLGDSSIIIDKDILKINKKQMASYPETKQARIIYGSVQRENNIEYARQKMLKDQADQREEQLQQNNKWYDFKVRRKYAIEQYIAAKSIQRKSEQLVILIKRGLWISKFAKFFKEYIKKRVKEENILFCLFRAKFWWRQRMKKYQGSKNLVTVHNNKIRYCLTVDANAQYRGRYHESSKIFLTVVKDLCYVVAMKNKFRLAYSQLSRIQKGFRRAIGAKKYTYSKFKQAWDTKLSEMHHKAMGKKTKGNAETLKQCHNLMASDKDPTSPKAILVRKFLEKWLYWCQLKYSIAFFQWRKMFKMYKKEECFPLRCATQDEELDEVYDSKIGYIRRYAHRLYERSEQIRIYAINHPPKNSIKKNESKGDLAAVKDDKKNPRRSAKKSGGESQKEVSKFEINHFHEIGWMHPDKKVQVTTFAGEKDCNNIVRKEFDDLVYDDELYVSGDFVPAVIWMPCDEIIQVMIKAVAVAPDIDTLLYSFGIPSLCFKCGQDLNPATRDRFMFTENEFKCVHTDYHIKCMIDVAKEQDVPIEKVSCPVCLQFQKENEEGDGHEHHHHD